MAWMLCGSSQLVSFAYEPKSQPESWTYRQSYGKEVSSSPVRSSSVGYQMTSDIPVATGSTYRSSSVYGGAFNTTFSEDVRTDYNFRSTSRYTPAAESTPAYSAPMNGPRKASGWGRPTDNPIGTIEAPVGEPLILLLMVVLYGVIVRLRTRVGVKG